jgi:hypothetical protein
VCYLENRDTETQRHRDRETERQRDRETEIQRHRDTKTQRHRDTETQSHRDTETQRQRDREKKTCKGSRLIFWQVRRDMHCFATIVYAANEQMNEAPTTVGLSGTLYVLTAVNRSTANVMIRGRNRTIMLSAYLGWSKQNSK